ncbi:MAG: hypothetical protein LBC18_14270 [Opitutaceae bacterium]|nr:hypothetical protein [Opitutaceae bacterium]
MAHNDDAGYGALCRWSGQLQDAGAERVASFNFAKWRDRAAGAAIDDLNDFLRADAGGTLERRT